MTISKPPALNLIYQWDHVRKKAKEAPKEEPKKATHGTLRDDRIRQVIDVYSHLKTVKGGDRDILIIEGMVMCPLINVAVPADNCKSCGKYICTIKTDDAGLPNVRCLKAGV